MDLEIHTATAASQTASKQSLRASQSRKATQDSARAIARKIAQQAEEQTARQTQQMRTPQQYLDEILAYTQFFNRRLKFSINEDLGQVVVKVIDAKSDKVIKEIPPKVLQNLHVRIREAIGLLIDETI